MSTIVLMAGGTGGHLFPAMSLAEELRRRGHIIHLMTDERVQTYGQGFPARDIHLIPSATPSVRNPFKFVFAGIKIAIGTLIAYFKLGSIRPGAVVAFGGYPVVPPFLAASMRRIPGLLHEQNAVLGRANRFLARRALGIALSFDATKGSDLFEPRTKVTGNPIRDRVRQLADKAVYRVPDGGEPFRLLVVGGSQGARAFADLVPPAIANIPDSLRNRLHVAQQCRPEDLERVTSLYREMKLNVELATFFEDLPERMAASHLTICRSGASTIAELAALGAPALLIPLPGALDADQTANAAVIAAAGGGWIMPENTITAHSLGKRLTDLLREPQVLEDAAARVKNLGQLDAVEHLADLTEEICLPESG